MSISLSFEQKQIAAYRLAEADGFAQHPDVYWIEAEQKSLPETDKLTKIEGIGPKIEKLFFEKGILTFADLAGTKVSTLRAILKAAGPRFSVHTPTSWPKQAKLARDGKWEKLKALQAELIGGK